MAHTGGARTSESSLPRPAFRPQVEAMWSLVGSATSAAKQRSFYSDKATFHTRGPDSQHRLEGLTAL